MSDNTKLSKFQWRYFAAPEIPDILDEITGFIDDELLLPDGRCLNGVKFDFPANGIINMYDIIDPIPAPLARTILTADFYADAPGKCFVGLGADWKWTFRFNNEMLINALISCNRREEIEVLGEGLGIKKYCDGDLQISGRVYAVKVLSQTPSKRDGETVQGS